MLAIYRLLHNFFFIYKNLHIEPFNYTIKSVYFIFCSTNVGSSVIKTGRSEGSLLPYFYRFRCHYPLITYLNTIHILRQHKGTRWVGVAKCWREQKKWEKDTFCRHWNVARFNNFPIISLLFLIFLNGWNLALDWGANWTFTLKFWRFGFWSEIKMEKTVKQRKSVGGWVGFQKIRHVIFKVGMKKLHLLDRRDLWLTLGEFSNYLNRFFEFWML